ncbi:TsoY family (seleno)protein [Sporosarcina pasteurii]|uniref:Uncharacterized protein n=1 Tax=Sporosarcina pasteurii TaxID=1474 RepID=A0A380BD70_SPOPA|nr:hypothetical protein [Sporosarcina pasteurii]MDS9472916.1 hypothetical protein [Sporosarcina pasteurii]SUI98426.1 Uncharacterised protein [Sporosarcina pasteurii]
MKSNYNPLYFLAALGNGGLAVSFFMYLMFMVPHPNTPMATFNDIYPYITGGSPFVSISIVVALLAIIYFAVKHFEKIIWNVKEFNKFKKTEAYQALRSSNGEVSLMAIPLTFAMMINVLFILGAVFIPGLWNYVQLLLPFALLGFMVVGYYALNLFVRMMTRFMTTSSFKEEANNHFSQLLSAFAFTMVAVGFAAPGAMSHNIIVSSVGILFAILFTLVSLVLITVWIALGLQSIFKSGFALEAGPSIWMLIPILTLIGITGVRVTSGLAHNFLGIDPNPLISFVGLGAIITAQIVVGILGYSVLTKISYFNTFTKGSQNSAGSYGLICPGVAFSVLGMFFIHWGLVQNGVVDKFSIAYFIFLAPFTIVQFKTIQVLSKLNKKHFNSTTVTAKQVQERTI